MSDISTTNPNYGIDAPNVLRNMALLSVVLLVLGVVLWWWNPLGIGIWLLVALGGASVPSLTGAILMLLYARYGKFRLRDRILGHVLWRGDEAVLDVGTGKGLLLIGSAKHLTSGTAIGIDIWNAEDLSGNNVSNTLRNIEIEGVKDRAQVKSEDARKMSFPELTFDVVVSNLCLHNIPDQAERAQACLEIVRVLKPGGVALIADFRCLAEYHKVFTSAGLKVTRDDIPWWISYPVLCILVAQKPR